MFIYFLFLKKLITSRWRLGKCHLCISRLLFAYSHKEKQFSFLNDWIFPHTLIFSHASKSVEDVLIYILNKNTSQVVFTHLHDIIKMYTSIFSFSQKYHENKYKYQYQQTFVKVIGNTYYQQNAYFLPLHCSKLLFSEMMRSIRVSMHWVHVRLEIQFILEQTSAGLNADWKWILN